jgi:hypothetical protein
MRMDVTAHADTRKNAAIGCGPLGDRRVARLRNQTPAANGMNGMGQCSIIAKQVKRESETARPDKAVIRARVACADSCGADNRTSSFVM